MYRQIITTMNLGSVNWRQGYEGGTGMSTLRSYFVLRQWLWLGWNVFVEVICDLWLLKANPTRFIIVNLLPSYSKKGLHNLKSLIPLSPYYGGFFHGKDISSPHPLARICPSYWWEWSGGDKIVHGRGYPLMGDESHYPPKLESPGGWLNRMVIKPTLPVLRLGFDRAWQFVLTHPLELRDPPQNILLKILTDIVVKLLLLYRLFMQCCRS